MTRHGRSVAIVCLAFAATASAQTPAGGEFRINTYTTGTQTIARPAMEPDGDFVVVWTSFPQDGNNDGAFGQRFAASGVPRGSEFRINTYTTGSQGLPAVAVGSRGDFVVVWESVEDDSGQSIQGRLYDTGGNPIGAEFLVNTFTTGYQFRPRVGRAADGRFVVSWTSQNVDGSAYGIAARRFDASGNSIGAEFVVNTYTTGDQRFGDLAVEANGNFVAVWEDYDNNRDGSGAALLGQRHDAAGNRLGSEFQVNSYTTGNQRLPSVSVSPAGGFVIAWASQFQDGSSYGVFARRFDASGNAVGNDFVVNTYTPGSQSGVFGQVAHDARGNFVVTWGGPGDGSVDGSFAQRFSASGARRGAEFRVNTYTPGMQFLPSVASDSVGNFVVAWDSVGQDGSNVGIFAKRFGGLAPTALTVDIPGNLVLEPGETVDVRPTWRNFNGAAQTFGGTLTNIGGPAGPTYTITDAAGDYGTVANGATAPCTDCYAVSVSNPATRPAVHWDASAIESILPDTQGQQKQWRLHVGGSFTDVPTSSPFYRFIETLLHHGVTSGCSATAYCPASATTREQMAVFVLVAKEGTGYVPPACATPVFADVPASSPFCRWIEELARRAVVSGCGGGNYCPGSVVTREQMAVFVLRTLDQTLSPPACAPPNLYLDVPETSPFCRWIEELTRRGVVTGCGGGNYCPAASVTREQMGVFISATFGLTLYGS
jgi:S-layer family protein